MPATGEGALVKPPKRPRMSQAPANRDQTDAWRIGIDRLATGNMAAEVGKSKNALRVAPGCRSLGQVLAAVDRMGLTDGRDGWRTHVKQAVERGDDALKQPWRGDRHHPQQRLPL